jgi:hypothetical protein
MMPLAIVNLSVTAVVPVAVLDTKSAVIEAKFHFQTAAFGAPANNIHVSGSARLNPAGESPRRTHDTLVTIHADIVAVSVQFQSTTEDTIIYEVRISNKSAMMVITGVVLGVAVKRPITLQSGDNIARYRAAGKSQRNCHHQTQSLLTHNNPPLKSYDKMIDKNYVFIV